MTCMIKLKLISVLMISALLQGCVSSKSNAENTSEMQSTPTSDSLPTPNKVSPADVGIKSSGTVKTESIVRPEKKKL